MIGNPWRRVRLGAVVLVGAFAVAACSSGSGSAAAKTGTTTSTTAQAATSPSSASGCGSAQAPGTTTVTVAAGGRNRSVIVHVPSGYTGHTPLALVMNLHGSGSTAAVQEAFSGMDATADREMFVVAYPQAAIPAGTGFDWNVPGQPLVGGRRVPAGAADDIAFLDRAMTVLEGRYCIDPHHLDVTGISGGARTASQVGCDLGDRVAAIAPVSGLRYPDPCPGAQPMPVLAFHGTADPVDPFGGNGQAYWTYSVPEAARRWAVHNGCATKPASAAPAAAEQVVTYAGCHGGATVELTVLRGAGHTWPGGPPLPPSVQAELGPTSRAVNANEMMWTFFQAHPLP